MKVIYMTGYTDDMVVHHKVLEPGVDLLQKPFTRDQLVRTVRSVLDRASRGIAIRARKEIPATGSQPEFP